MLIQLIVTKFFVFKKSIQQGKQSQVHHSLIAFLSKKESFAFAFLVYFFLPLFWPDWQKFFVYFSSVAASGA